jgi:SAM-dependent methyltransferase
MNGITEFARSYDKFMLDSRMQEIYGDSGFFNVGYWSAGTSDQRSACENLLDHVVSPVELVELNEKKILDVACGCGATTGWIKARAPAAWVAGINISDQQLRTCRSRAPGCAFLLMDAAQTGFHDASFDCVICVEAAFHFNTRVSFLREAFRILRPGGRLLLSDILFADTRYIGEWMAPLENSTKSMADYEELLEHVGFEQGKVLDATDQCWTAFCRRRIEAIGMQFGSGTIDAHRFQLQTQYLHALLNDSVRHYIIASAQKLR